MPQKRLPFCEAAIFSEIEDFCEMPHINSLVINSTLYQYVEMIAAILDID